MLSNQVSGFKFYMSYLCCLFLSDFLPPSLNNQCKDYEKLKHLNFILSKKTKLKKKIISASGKNIRQVGRPNRIFLCSLRISFIQFITSSVPTIRLRQL